MFAKNVLVREVSYSYPGETKSAGDKSGSMPVYEKLNANYQTPSNEVATFYNPGSDASRTVTQQTHYNDYGQIVSQTKENGTVTTNVYEKAGVDNPLHQVLETTVVTAKGVTQHVENTLTADHLQIAKKVATASTATNPTELQPISTTAYQYDAQGRVISQTVRDDFSDKDSNVVPSITSQIAYPKTGTTRSVVITDQFGHSVTKTYSLANGELLTKEDAKGNKMIYAYDDLQRVTSVSSQAANGQAVQLKKISYSNAHDTGKNSMTVTYPLTGLVEQTVFDGLGRKIAVFSNNDDHDASTSGLVPALRELASVAYNAQGKKASSSVYSYINDAKQTYTTNYFYDALGRVYSTVYPDESVLHQSYDDVAHTMTSYRKGLDKKTTAARTITQNNDNKAIQQITVPGSTAALNSAVPSSLKTTAQYDGLDRVTTSSDLNMKTTMSTVYNAFNKVANKTLSNKANESITVAYHYDPLLGKVTRKSLTNSAGEKKQGYLKIYNALSQLTDETDTNGATQHYTYDADGNMVTKSDWSGKADKFTVYTYQFIAGKNRLTNTRFTQPGPSDHAGTHLSYDTSERVISVSYVDSSNGQVSLTDTIRYSYYPDGKLKTTTYSDGKIITNTYNVQGQLLSRKDAAGITSHYSYDDMQRLQQVSSPNATVTYQYDSLGRLSERDAYTDAAKQNLVGKTTYTYDAYNAVSTIQNYNQANQVTSLLAYTYYDNGNVKTKTSTVNGKTQEVDYVYDTTTDRLLSSQTYAVNVLQGTKTLMKTDGYQLDIGGNVKSKTETLAAHTVNGVSVNSRSTTQKNSYNQLDQLTSFDAKGNFRYDANGNMTQDDKGNVYTYNSSNQLISFTSVESGVTTTYAYYPDGTRQSKSTQGGELTFYYAGSTLINAQDCQQQFSSYLIGAKREARTVNGNTHFYDYDRHGSVILTLFQGGADQGINQYDDYGVLTQSAATQESTNGAASLTIDPFKYAGGYRDQESGLYYLQARYYSPRLMHFIQRDSYDYINRYAYCGGNPIMRLDLTGHSFFGDVGKFFKEAVPQIAGMLVGSLIMSTAAATEVLSMGTMTVPVAVGASLAIGLIGGAAGSATTSAVSLAMNHQRLTFKNFGMPVIVGAAFGLFTEGVAGYSAEKMGVSFAASLRRDEKTSEGFVKFYEECAVSPLLKHKAVRIFGSLILGSAYGAVFGGITSLSKGKSLVRGIEQGAVAGAISGVSFYAFRSGFLKLAKWRVTSRVMAAAAPWSRGSRIAPVTASEESWSSDGFDPFE